MTIRLITSSRSSSCRWYILSDVKEVTQFRVTFHDGSFLEKRVCTKVELLSVMDAPNEDPERVAFFANLGCTKFDKILEREVVSTEGWYKMTSEQFSGLDLLNYL